MNKKKSIALLVVISIVLVVLAVLTFAQFRIPGYKNGTKIYQSFWARSRLTRIWKAA